MDPLTYLSLASPPPAGGLEHPKELAAVVFVSLCVCVAVYVPACLSIALSLSLSLFLSFFCLNPNPNLARALSSRSLSRTLSQKDIEETLNLEDQRQKSEGYSCLGASLAESLHRPQPSYLPSLYFHHVAQRIG